jgi:acyl-CoA synthetase (AMP-forming)/AMP-acid ligase II
VQRNRPIVSNRVFAPGCSTTVGELLDAFTPQAARLSLGAGPVALVSPDEVELVAAAAWLAQTRIDGMVLPQDRLTPNLRTMLAKRGYRVVELAAEKQSPPDSNIPPREGRITLLTSGTTGEPKTVEHTWETLFTMGKVRAPKPANWLLTYQGGTYAWFQMLTLLLFLPGQSLTIARERNPLALIEAALAGGATAISATPTFWRLACLQFPRAELQRLLLQQITLGGEPVDQAILDQLKALFPAATLTHIYASSEAGACIVVRDAREGFPAGWLVSGDNPVAGESPQLQVREGILWIRSPFALSGADDWINSGDVAEIRGDRVILLGRKETSMINVGGAKVPAHEVEKVLLAHPSVAWCRVSRRRAPFLGELVAADVVFRPGAGAPTEAELARHCGGWLAEHMVPRFWNLLDHIPVTDNLKTKVT